MPEYTDFPCEDWRDVDFVRYTDARKLAWAARAASKRWLAALETHDLAGVDTFDFILAVYDRAHEWWVPPERDDAAIAGRCASSTASARSSKASASGSS